MPMRKVLVGVTGAAIVVAVLIVGAVGADFGASIYAEYRLSTTVRKAANLRSDPFVAILRFPFIPQAMREHYAELEIRHLPWSTPEVARPLWRPLCIRSTCPTRPG